MRSLKGKNREKKAQKNSEVQIKAEDERTDTEGKPLR
jgi:hypothetical protein